GTLSARCARRSPCRACETRRLGTPTVRGLLRCQIRVGRPRCGTRRDAQPDWQGRWRSVPEASSRRERNRPRPPFALFDSPGARSRGESLLAERPKRFEPRVDLLVRVVVAALVE